LSKTIEIKSELLPYFKSFIIMDIHKIVFSFTRIHPNGFNPTEIEELLKLFPIIDLEKFNFEIHDDTYIMDEVNNLPIRYTIDIYRAIDVAVTGRLVHSLEWD
jgi:hypothetical protein